MEKNKKNAIRIWILIGIVFVLIISGFISYYIIKYIDEPTKFRNFIDSFGIYSPLIFILMSILQILIPIIPGEPMEIAAGYAFGGLKGSILCLIAASIGSFIVISLVKKYGRKIVEIFFNKEKIESLKFLKDSKKNIILFAIIFIIPGTPKDLLCYFAGLTDIDSKTLVLIASVGRLPSIITSTLIGDGIGDKNYMTSINVFVITAILSLAGIFLYNYLSNKKK